MKPSSGHLRVLKRDIAPYAVSAEGALRFVTQTRKQGGLLALLATTFMAFIVFGCAVAAATEPVFLLGTVLGAWPFMKLLKTGLQTSEVARAIADLSHLRRPLSAALIDRVLVVGTSGTPLDAWCAVPVSADQEQTIRSLALPSAMVVRT